MRFVRALLDPTSGEPIGAVESEWPIVGESALFDATGVVVTLPHFDMGLFYDFDPADLVDKPGCVAVAIARRIEKHPAADSHPDAPKVRIRAGVTDLPAGVFCPSSEAAIAAHLRANGVTRLPAIAQAWLSWVLPQEKKMFMGLDAAVSLGMLKALESNRRGLSDGGKIKHLERKIQQQSDERAALAREKRKAIDEPAAEKPDKGIK